MKKMRDETGLLCLRARLAAVRRTFGACLVGLALAAGSAPDVLAAGNSIESVSSVQQGSTTWVRIGFRDELHALPVTFAVSNPPRVALDFADTDNRAGQNSIELPQGDVRSAAVVQSGDRTRIVLNLKRALGYDATIDGKTLVVALQPVAAAGATASSARNAVRDDAGSTAAAGELRAVDFRRGDKGEGRIIVDLSRPGMNVDIRRQGQSIVADFINAQIPADLQRQLDVGDFGTPVRTVRTFRQGSNARLVVEPRGSWEHNAYQSDTQFIVEVVAVQDDQPSASGARPRYDGERLSLNFQNVEIRALLQVIADFTNLNIVTSDSVQGNITLRLMDVPWDQALAIILDSRSLGMRRTGNVIIVAPREELAEREKREFEEHAQIAEIEPLRTETFQLNYQKAEALQRLLVSEKQRVLSRRGSVVVDQRTNKVFVQDTAGRLEEVRRVIAQVDIPVRQVLIEARIVQADDSFSRSLGVRLGFNRINAKMGGTRGSIGGNLEGVHDLSGLPGSLMSGATSLPNTNFVNLPASSGVGSGNPASFALSLFNPGMTKFLNLELSALEADERGKVVSSPRVLTTDQRTAVIEQGTEIPYKTDAGGTLGGTSIEFRKASLILEVTPQITPEGSVILDVKVNKDSPDDELATGGAGVAIKTRRVETQVLVENGGTVVIGGIYEQEESNGVEKVPLLGDIPILGHAFKSTLRKNNRKELLVFLTPRVVLETALAD